MDGYFFRVISIMKPSFLSAVVGAGLTHALPTIEAVGNKFFTSKGDQFFLKGNIYCSHTCEPQLTMA